MAHGLPQFLWACPHCFTLGGLALHPADHDAIRCERCGAAWSVDVAQRLSPRPESAVEAAATTVPRAHDRIVAHFAGSDGRATAEPATRSGDGVHLEGDGSVVAVADDGQHTAIGSGRLVLRERTLELLDGVDLAWSADLDAVSGLSLEAGSVLQLRVDGELFQLLVERPSTIAWHHFIGSGLPEPP